MLPLVAFFYFNPRSHERSDKSPVGAMFVGNNISIHAPTRGATGTPVTGVKGAKISIHAPTRGATKQLPLSIVITDISIHAPTRGATRLIHAKFIIANISIHAPTRGATLPPNKNRLTHVYFNPRSHERSDCYS